MKPLSWELPSGTRSVDVFRCLSDQPHCLFLDSAQQHPTWGRFSYVAADPHRFLTVPADGREALRTLDMALADCPCDPLAERPPFQGGAAGLLSFDLARSLERLPRARHEEFPVPAIALGLYDVVIAFDHLQSRSWILSQGWPETDPTRRRDRAQRRLQEFQQRLARNPQSVPPCVATPPPCDLPSDSPRHPVGRLPRLLSNFSEAEYLWAVQSAIDYILAGDLFQVNLAQRLLHPATADAVSLYFRLRRCNPAPFAAYFDVGEVQIVSASPERFLRAERGQVETRPIKGTRPRAHRPEADLFSRDDLRQSGKDRAENVMIVDLLRNDLSRVCHADSVQVEQLCAVETFEYVQHLVSVITGQLEPGRSAVDLVRATFPGGSITGAPKVRAMEIISELEPHAGCLLWLDRILRGGRSVGFEYPDSNDHRRGRLVAVAGGGGDCRPVQPAARIRRDVAQSRRAAAPCANPDIR